MSAGNRSDQTWAVIAGGVTALDEGASDGEAGHQVPCGPAAGDHRPGLIRAVPGAHRARATDMRTPTASMHIIREDPP